MKQKKDLKRQLVDLLAFVPLLFFIFIKELVFRSDNSGLSAFGLFMGVVLLTPLIALAGTGRETTGSALKTYLLLDGLLVLTILIAVISQ